MGDAGSRNPWKSSCLPLLWCGLQESLRERYTRLESIDQMRKIGDEAKISLCSEERAKVVNNIIGYFDKPRWVLKEAID